MDSEAVDGGSVQPPDDPGDIDSFVSWLKSILPDSKEGSSDMPEDPDMDSESDDGVLVQSPDPPYCTSDTSSVSGVSMKSDISNHRIINFPVKRRDVVIQKTNVGSGTETLLKHLPPGTSAGWSAVDTRLVLQREWELRLQEREQQLREQLRGLELRDQLRGLELREQQLQEQLRGLELRGQQLRELQEQLRGLELRELRMRERELRELRELRERELRELQEREQLRERKRKLLDSESLLYNFEEGSSDMPECPDMDSGLNHHHLPQSPDPPRRDEVIQETHVGSGMEILLKHQLSGISAGWPAVDTGLVLQREQQLREREQQLREREQQLQELQERELQLRGRELREQLREQLRARELQDWELQQRGRELREREQQLREREQQEQQLWEQQLRELQEREQQLRKRKLPDSKSLLYNFEERCSHMPECPDMDSGLNHHHLPQSPDDLRSPKSFKAKSRRMLNNPILDLKKKCCHMREGPYMDSGLNLQPLLQPPDDPMQREEREQELQQQL